MSKKGSRAPRRAVLASAILVAATSANAAAPLTLTGWDARAVSSARTGALKRLESDECRKVLTDFTDAQGRSLQQNLEEWGASAAEYVGIIPFVDGSSQALCRKTKTALVATPGVRRVFVCKTFAEVQLRQPGIAESMVIHEILHTLGLGEAPMSGQPTSLEITQRIEARCR
jgi:peptidoglycan hydrolase-like protein with peptidoglycan-binding domain